MLDQPPHQVSDADPVRKIQELALFRYQTDARAAGRIRPRAPRRDGDLHGLRRARAGALGHRHLRRAGLTVSQRTREFGIRMALGASAGDVVAMVMRYGVRLAAIGLAIGIAGALALTRLMTTLLFDVKPGDPVVFTAVAVALMMVAVAASLAPSRRVIRIRPASALRYE